MKVHGDDKPKEEAITVEKDARDSTGDAVKPTPEDTTTVAKKVEDVAEVEDKAATDLTSGSMEPNKETTVAQLSEAPQESL